MNGLAGRQWDEGRDFRAPFLMGVSRNHYSRPKAEQAENEF